MYAVLLRDDHLLTADITYDSDCPDRCGHSGDVSHDYFQKLAVAEYKLDGLPVDRTTARKILDGWGQPQWSDEQRAELRSFTHLEDA